MKRESIYLVLVFFIPCAYSLYTNKSVRLASPSGKIKFSLTLGKNSPVYNVTLNKQTLIQDSPSTLIFGNGAFGESVKINRSVFSTEEETYKLIVGEAKHIHSLPKEIIIPLEETVQPFRKIDLVLRAFDDDIAFHYELPKQKGWDSYTVYNEGTTFSLQGNLNVTTLFLPSYQSSHEGKYAVTGCTDMDNKQLMDMLALFFFPNHVYMAIAETVIRDYTGMYLWKENGALLEKLLPKLGQECIKVEASLPHQSSWRALMISDQIGSLIVSNILANLNEPCKIKDTSWIKSGKTAFARWNGNVVPDTTFLGGDNFPMSKCYIDFVVRNGSDYHPICGDAEQVWYNEGGAGFGSPGPKVDILKVVSSLSTQEICNYAKSQDIRIHLWTSWKPLHAKINRAFAQFEKQGIVGMMIDFVDQDDREMTRIQGEFLAKAAKHHLFVRFHGVCKPPGLSRVYPNESTREDMLNYRHYGQDKSTDADHDIHMPFTRLLVGTTDYHLGGFHPLSRDRLKNQEYSFYIMNTRRHMLAMYVVLGNYLDMICDTPEAYEEQSGLEFLRAVFTIWDQTIVPNAFVSGYVTIIHKKGEDWFVGTTNNSQTRSIDVDLKFLDKNKKYKATICRDVEDTNIDSNKLVKEVEEIAYRDKIILSLASDGGSVFYIQST